jgi:hypothetical protein
MSKSPAAVEGRLLFGGMENSLQSYPVFPNERADSPRAAHDLSLPVFAVAPPMMMDFITSTAPQCLLRLDQEAQRGERANLHQVIRREALCHERQRIHHCLGLFD